MLVTFITIFPKLVSDFCSESLLGKAQAAGIVTISVVNPRDFSAPPHHKVDDIPYGGGAGMVMIAAPLIAAVSHAKQSNPQAKVILMSPSGTTFKQVTAKRYSTEDLIIVCGRYEGIDQRFIDLCVDEECSIGDFVLMGGEAAGLCVLEATVRLLPGVLGNNDSVLNESFDEKTGILEGPCYTRPPSIETTKGKADVPAMLLSGNHKDIETWRNIERQKKTERVRPELLENKKGPPHG